MRGMIAVVASSLVLAACSSDASKQAENPNVFPKDYKAEILNAMTTALIDPTNLKEAAISDPVLVQIANEQRYAVCVRANGRDLERNYAGMKEHIAYFYGGYLNQFIDAKPGDCGSKVAWKPFPEAEKLCLAKKCA